MKIQTIATLIFQYSTSPKLHDHEFHKSGHKTIAVSIGKSKELLSWLQAVLILIVSDHKKDHVYVKYAFSLTFFQIIH